MTDAPPGPRQAAAPTPWWLIPAGADWSGPVLLLPVGVDWDCARTPAALGMPVLDRLLAEPCDAAMLGPVLWDREADLLYWPVQRGASDHYPAGVDLLRAGAWIGVPGSDGALSSRAVWLHLPDRAQCTPPVWLAAALDTARPAPVLGSLR